MEKFALPLARLRMDNPGRGPQSMIGPIAVNNAEPGDVLEIRHRRIRPYEWGATFNNPSSGATIGCGAVCAKAAPQGRAAQLHMIGRRTARLTPADWLRSARTARTPSRSRCHRGRLLCRRDNSRCLVKRSGLLPSRLMILRQA
jgi:hypothetical protein